LLLELQRREIAQRRMDALDVVNVIEEAPDLPMGVREVVVLGEIDLLFFDGAHEAFGITVLARFAAMLGWMLSCLRRST
jgi:hypothetical protein